MSTVHSTVVTRNTMEKNGNRGDEETKKGATTGKPQALTMYQYSRRDSFALHSYNNSVVGSRIIIIILKILTGAARSG